MNQNLGLVEPKSTVADKLADLHVDKKGKGSWVGIILHWFIVACIALACYRIVEHFFFARSANAQIKAAVDRANEQKEAFENQIENLQKNAEAMKKEVNWARTRESHHIKERKKLEGENDELKKILESRIPSSLVR